MVVCVTGICMDRGILDNDMDGVAGGSCGDDCDDLDRSRFPGATEFCDGVDQDCDGNIDEEATPNALTWSLVSGDPLPSMSVLDDGLVVATRDGAGVGITITRLDRFGSALGAEPALEAVFIAEHRLVSRTSGATLIAAVATGFTLLRVSDIAVMPELEILTDSLPTHITATRYGDDQLAIVWVEGDDRVMFWSTDVGSGPPIEVAIVPGIDVGPIDVADDGTHLVVAVPPDAIFFLEREGAMVGGRDLEERTLAFAPLASGDGEVIALLRDAFDLTITGLTATSPIGRAPAPSVRDVTMPGRVDTLGDRIVVTRFSDGSMSIGGTTISLLDESFLPLATVDPSTTGSFGGPAFSWDVALHPDFTAVVTAFDGNLFGVTLGCGL